MPARSAVLLGTRFRHWGPVAPPVHAAFVAGYRDARPLTPVEECRWDVLVLWHAFAMVPNGPHPTGWRSSATDHLERAVKGH